VGGVYPRAFVTRVFVRANEKVVPLRLNPVPAEYVVLLSYCVNVPVVPSKHVYVNVVPLLVIVFIALD